MSLLLARSDVSWKEMTLFDVIVVQFLVLSDSQSLLSPANAAKEDILPFFPRIVELIKVCCAALSFGLLRFSTQQEYSST